MPRDNNGNYTLATGNPVQAGTVIQSVWANQTMEDIGSALSDSLDRYGRGGMLAPFFFTDGAVNAPGASFTNEPSSGLYRVALGDVRMSILAEDVMRWQVSGVQIWNSIDSQWEGVATGSDISALEADIATNTSNISTNASNISTNTSDISSNASNISTNTSDISALEANTVSSGTGLTGGGAISANPALALDTAYTDARYLSGNQTITLTGDVTGSGSTTISTTVGNNSHTHTGSTISALDASDTTTGTFATARIPSLDASKTTSGTFANARISQASVTQHQAAINAGSVDGYSIKVDSGSPSGTNSSTIYFVI